MPKTKQKTLPNNESARQKPNDQTTDLISSLNESQKKSVINTEGPLLILAGAGSGKTRALTHRIAYLIKEKKIPPRNILAVTFTNKAAGEMLERIKKLLNLPEKISAFSAALPHTGTFHSICARILRDQAEKIGYQKNFVIYDEQDHLACIKRIIKTLEISADTIKPNSALYAISAAKNRLQNATEFGQSAGGYFEETIARVYLAYEQELKKANALDFDDLILKVVALFKTNGEILTHYQELFRYILVDEYQDTNHAQYMFLKLLAEKYRNLCVVGDDFQSIYGWRQADIKNILNFEKDYPEAKIILMEQNYRSSQNILDAAGCVISKNKNQKKKNLWTENPAGLPLTVYEANDEKDEANFVINEIEKIKQEENKPLNQFAILYRTNAQSRALEEAFLKKNIPYRIVGGIKFYQRKEIKDILAFLNFIQNPFDKNSLERILGIFPLGAGKKTLEKIYLLAEESRLNLIQSLNNYASEKLSPSLKNQAFKNFVQLLLKFEKEKEKLSVSQLIEKIYEQSGYKNMLAKEGEEGKTRQENIQELLTVSRKYDNQENGLELFLEEIALTSQTDKDLENSGGTVMMTIHSAKGLEYDVVFIVGAEEGLFPHSRAKMNEKEMEEERRLCYVGITRARQKIYLIFTKMRNIYGQLQVSIRSRFIDEIDSHLIEEKFSENQNDFWQEEFILAQ